MSAKKAYWLEQTKQHSHLKGYLVIFPFSGGTAEYYHRWKISEDIGLIPIQLPGRSNRLSDAPLDSMVKLMEELLPLVQEIKNKPFIFYGHSLGALISLTLSKYLKKKKCQGPKALFVSGYHSPKRNLNCKKLSQLSDSCLIEELKKIGGTPEEIINDSELMQLCLPSIRADIKLGETYTYLDEGPLNFPITVFNGKDDHLLDRSTMTDWIDETERECSLIFLNGGHFFHKDHSQIILNKIKESFIYN